MMSVLGTARTFLKPRNYRAFPAGLTGPPQPATVATVKRPSYMDLALAEAEREAASGEVPVGAVLVDGETGAVLASAGNAVETEGDPTAHAEMLVLREAAVALGAPRLAGTHLYVTLEPCAMCAAAISLARVRRLYYGASDPKGGGVEHGARVFDQPTCHHRPEVYAGIGERRAAALLRAFFRDKRAPRRPRRHEGRG